MPANYARWIDSQLRRHRVSYRLIIATQYPDGPPRAPPADLIIKGVPRIKMAEHLASRKDSVARVIIP